MGDKDKKKIETHHKQVADGQIRRLQKTEERRINFEINRSWIKAKVEGERNRLAIAALVFLIGLMLVTFGLAYVAGVILYG